MGTFIISKEMRQNGAVQHTPNRITTVVVSSEKAKNEI